MAEAIAIPDFALGVSGEESGVITEETSDEFWAAAARTVVAVVRDRPAEGVNMVAEARRHHCLRHFLIDGLGLNVELSGHRFWREKLTPRIGRRRANPKSRIFWNTLSRSEMKDDVRMTSEIACLEKRFDKSRYMVSR